MAWKAGACQTAPADRGRPFRSIPRGAALLIARGIDYATRAHTVPEIENDPPGNVNVFGPSGNVHSMMLP